MHASTSTPTNTASRAELRPLVRQANEWNVSVMRRDGCLIHPNRHEGPGPKVNTAHKLLFSASRENLRADIDRDVNPGKLHDLLPAGSRTAKKVVFIRHGETNHNKSLGEEFVDKNGLQTKSPGKGYSGTSPNAQLNSLGITQAYLTGKNEVSDHLSGVVQWIVSDTVRTQQTANAVWHGAKLDPATLDIVKLKEIVEREPGKLTGMTHEEAQAKMSEDYPNLQLSMKKEGPVFHNVHAQYPPGTAEADDGKHFPGESMGIVANRFVPAFLKLLEQSEVDTIVIVAHEMIGKILVEYLEKGTITAAVFGHKIENGKAMPFADLKRDELTWAPLDIPTVYDNDGKIVDQQAADRAKRPE